MNNYFCVMPFYGAEFNLNNKPTPCCLLPKDADIEKVRQEMLSQKRPKECSKCWELEDSGRTSDRQIKNSSFDFYSDTDINLLEENCKAGNFSPQIFKFYTSNLCNSTCVTCQPFYSSKWQSLLSLPIKKIEIEDDILDWIDLKVAKIITFVGGEPLHEKKNFDILEKLVALGNTDCFISIVTNGSIKLTPAQEDIFRKFKHVNLCISIDGIGKQFEYIRYPLKWDNLLKNIDGYRNCGAKLSASFTISNLNILYYQEIVNWFEKNHLEYNHNMVSQPKQFHIEVLPPNVKRGLQFITAPESFDIELFSLFVKTIEDQDKVKNINIRDYLPELSEIIDNFRKN